MKRPILALLCLALSPALALEPAANVPERGEVFQRFFGVDAKPADLALGSNTVAKAPALEILSASYGVDKKRIVVTDVLRPHIAHGAFLLRAPWGLGNPDPQPGTVKNIVIVYRYNGTESTASFHQREDILLPPEPKGLAIISANYGVPNSRVDATEAVRAAVQDDAIRLSPHWGLGRLDPAAGKIKTVEITYYHEGALHTASFSQDDELVLP